MRLCHFVDIGLTVQTAIGGNAEKRLHQGLLQKFRTLPRAAGEARDQRIQRRRGTHQGDAAARHYTLFERGTRCINRILDQLHTSLLLDGSCAAGENDGRTAREREGSAALERSGLAFFGERPDAFLDLGAAHAVAGAPVGVNGHVGIFSFYATKMITSGGQGGMLVSRDRGLADAARDYRQFDGRHDRKPRFNFQMTDLQAAIGRVQLRKLPGFVARRDEIFARYRAAGFDLLDEKSHGVPVRYRSIVRTESPRAIIDKLAQYDIKAIVPVEDWELLDAADQYPNAAALTRTTVSLPTYPLLSDEELSRVIDVLDKDTVSQENRASSKWGQS